MLLCLGLGAQVERGGLGEKSVVTGLDFYCEGDYFEIEGKKYYNGATAFICGRLFPTSSGESTIDIIAYHADGTLFPASTSWNGVIFPISGAIAKINRLVATPNMSGGINVNAFYQAGPNIESISITVIFVKISFEESVNQLFGYDPNLFAGEHNYPSFGKFSWKSVLLNSTDAVDIKVDPFELALSLELKSSDPDHFPVSPINLSSNPQEVEVGGYSEFSVGVIEAKTDISDECNDGDSHSKLAVVAYPSMMRKVKFIVIEEEKYFPEEP